MVHYRHEASATVVGHSSDIDLRKLFGRDTSGG